MQSRTYFKGTVLHFHLNMETEVDTLFSLDCSATIGQKTAGSIHEAELPRGTVQLSKCGAEIILSFLWLFSLISRLKWLQWLPTNKYLKSWSPVTVCQVPIIEHYHSHTRPTGSVKQFQYRPSQSSSKTDIWEHCLLGNRWQGSWSEFQKCSHTCFGQELHIFVWTLWFTV